MSVEQLEQSVLQLSAEERRQFFDWMDDHRHEIAQGEPEVSEGVKREIRRRSAELRDHPALAQPVDSQYFERMKRQVADALARKTSAV